MSANSSTHSHHSNQPLVSGRTSSDGQRQNSQPQHNLPQRDLYASSSPTTTHINVGGGGGGSVQNPLMPPGSRRATILDLPPSRRDSKRASVVGPPTFSPKYGNLALLTSADDGAPLPLDDLSPTNNNNRRATDASSVSSSDSKHRQREPREHSNVSTQLQELTPKEIIEAERRLAAQQAAHSAIQNVEKEEERNLTLWEQAQWNAKVYAVVESGSFPSDIPYSVETAAIVVALLTAIVILLSCTSILALSYPQYVLDAPSYWSDIEVFCVVIFTLDLVLRCLTCPNKVRFLYDFFNWVDVISILPYYVGVFGGTSFPWYLRIIRAMRIARLVKVLQARGILGLKDFLNTIQESIAGVVLYFIVAITGLLVFSTLMYFSERGEFDDPTHLWWRQCTPYEDPCVYPNLTTLMAMANVSSNNTNSSNSSNSTFVAPILNSNHTGTEVSPFQSISGALWFTINTMTTTGTGEVEGTSSPGKLATAVMGFAGVFFIGLPVMILAGNHEAHGAMSTVSVVRNTWAELHRRKRRLAGSVLGSLEIVRRYFGWSPAVDEAWKDLQATVDAANGNIRLQPINQPAGAAYDKDQQQKVRAAVVVGYYRIQGMLREIRMSMVDPDEFLFEPLYMLLKDDRGRPKGRVIWSRNGLPTIVEFRIVLEDEDTRNAVAKVAGQLNPNARICCDSHSGLQIRHTSPLDALRTQEVGTDGTEAIHTITRWTMLPVVPRPGFRDRTFPIYFKRTGGTWDSADAHQDDEYNFSEEEIVNDALSSLLGSGLLVESYIPIPPVRRRLMVVTQFLQQTRLHRALELCAHRASRHVPFHKLTAYITDSDFVRLLEGVGRRLELVDPSLAIEDLAAVERAVADVLLDRLRKTKVVQIPVCFRRCLYNSEVLEDDDIVYEVPLSLFVGDEEDEVEQDSVGYVEVTARAGYGRAVRVEFMIGMGPQSENGRPRVESFVTATAST